MRSALIVLAAAGGIVALSHILQQPEPAQRSPQAPAGAPVVLGVPPSDKPQRHAEREHEHDRVQVQHAPAAATAAARNFLDAYLRWETGDDSRDLEQQLTASATPRLQELLGSGRGQPPHGSKVSPAQLVSLVAGTAPEGQAATIAARLQRNARRSDLAVVVRRIDGRWQVDALGR